MLPRTFGRTPHLAQPTPYLPTKSSDTFTVCFFQHARAAHYSIFGLVWYVWIEYSAERICGPSGPRATNCFNRSQKTFINRQNESN